MTESLSELSVLVDPVMIPKQTDSFWNQELGWQLDLRSQFPSPTKVDVREVAVRKASRSSCRALIVRFLNTSISVICEPMWKCRRSVHIAQPWKYSFNPPNLIDRQSKLVFDYPCCGQISMRVCLYVRIEPYATRAFTDRCAANWLIIMSLCTDRSESSRCYCQVNRSQDWFYQPCEYNILRIESAFDGGFISFPLTQSAPNP